MTERGSGRVCMVTSNLPRWEGDSTTPFVLHLAQDLMGLGWDIRIIAPHAPGAAQRETMGGVPVERFRYLLPERAQTVCYQGGALVNLRERRWNYLKVPPLVAAEWIALVRLLRGGRADLVHSHWVLPQGLVGVMAARPLKIPHVLTVHGGDVFGLRTPLLDPLKRLAFRGADAVTVNSSATELAVRRIAPGLKRLRRIPMGVAESAGPWAVDPEEIRSRYRRGSGPLVVFVGRLVEEKGLGDLLDAIGQLKQRLPDVALMVLGEGQHRSDFEERARSLEVEDRVHFLGWVDTATVPAYLSSADLLAGPSRTGRDGWVEAQGLVFAEALLAGIPVVASASGGIPDTVVHERTGLLVPEGSAHQLAAAIERLHVEPGLGPRLAAEGRRYARAELTRPRTAESFSRLFREVMER